MIKKLTKDPSGVAAAWRKQYEQYDNGNDRWMAPITLCDGKTFDPKAVYRELLVCSGTKDEIDAIIGNESWTGFQCDECDDYSIKVFQMGEPPNQYNTLMVCPTCAQRYAQFITDNL